MQSSRQGKLFVNVLVMLFGLILLIPSLYKITSFSYHHVHADLILGEVVDKGMGRTFGCRPYIQYSDRAGSILEFKTRIIYHFVLCPDEGDQVKILYREGMPDRTIVASYFHHVVLACVFLLLGLYLIYAVLSRRLQ